MAHSGSLALRERLQRGGGGGESSWMCVIDTTIKVASKQAAFEMGKHSIAQRAESLSLLPFSLTDSSMLSSGTLRGREPLPQAQQSRSTIAFLPFYITVIATAGLGLYVGFSRKQA